MGSSGLVVSGGLLRPDWTSASVTARAARVPVEVLSARSETTRQWVYPDGHVRVEQATGPVRFKDPKGRDGWSDIDTTLIPDGAGFKATALPGSVRIGHGGDPVVTDSSASGSVAMSLPGVVLPDPVVSGSTATFADVVPGVDVQVEVRPAGFQLVWLVKSAAGAAELVSRYGSSGSVVLPLTTSGTGLDAQAVSSGSSAGGVVFSHKGHRLGQLKTPVVWDSKNAVVNGVGVQVPAAFRVGKAQARGSVTSTGLSLGVDQAWLSDPGRVFPVTIDPTYASTTTTPSFDTFVEQGYTTDQSGSSEVKLGNNGSGQVARTYLNFNNVFQGKTIMSASLSLHENWSWSCSQRKWWSYDAWPASTSTTWTSQPRLGSQRASSMETLGYSSSCPNARVRIDMLDQVKAWTNNSSSTVAMMLRADDETDPYGWKRFASGNTSTPPVIDYSYDRAPGTPGVPGVAGLVTVGSKPFVGSAQPKMTVKAPSDADGNTSKLEVGWFTSSSSTSSWTSLCTTGYVSAGTSTSCTPSALADNSHGWVRTRAYDGYLWSGWSGTQEVYVALSSPPTPAISCGTANGSWADALPTDSGAVSCTITVTAASATSNSAPTSVRYAVDGGSTVTATVTQPTTTTPSTVSVSTGMTAGWHSVTATAVSPVGKTSGTASYGYGFGAATMSSPLSGTKTAGSITVSAASAPKGTADSVTGTVQWRVLGSTGWANLIDESPFSTSSSTTTTLSGRLDTSSVVGQSDADGVKVAARTATSIQLRVCFAYVTGTSTQTKCTTNTPTVVRVPHAFGQGYPTTSAGPGQVALWTGEFQYSESDADLATGSGTTLSVGRTYQTFAGVTSPAQGVFGPGWTASLDAGDTSGLSGAAVYDQTTVDGTIVLATPDGDTLVFTAGHRRTTGTWVTGSYQPVDDDTATSGITLTVGVNASGILTLTYTDDSDVVTTFTATQGNTSADPVTFSPDSVTDKVSGDSTSYQRDSSGRVTAIIGPTAASSCTVGTRIPGCRILNLHYTAVNGNQQVTSITAQVDGESTDRTLATYQYSADGTLSTETDTVTNLTTTYSWASMSNLPTPVLTSLTPPGLEAYRFAYDSAGRLSSVMRNLPGTSTPSQLAAFVYGADTSVSDFNLGQFDVAGNSYGLPRKATQVFAVFGPDQVVVDSNNLAVAPPATSDAWHRADVFLTDDQGYLIHQGSFGAGAWQLNALVYDDHDNVVTAWDARATEQIRQGVITEIDDAATYTVYNPDWCATRDSSGVCTSTVTTPAGTLVTETISPAREMTDATGATVYARTVTDTSYDNGDQAKINTTTGQPYRLVTQTRTTTQVQDDTSAWVQHDVLSVANTSYDGQAVTPGSLTPATNPVVTGWDLGQATSVTTVMATTGQSSSADISRESVYDTKGRVVESRQPSAAGSNTSPGTRLSVYYTSGTNQLASACGNHPEWEGLVCQAGPAGGTQLPIERTTGYTWDLQPTGTLTSNGTATVTTTTSYDNKSRPTTVTTTSSGVAGMVTVPALTTSYDDKTGLATGTSSDAGTTATSYDGWGRQVTYTNTPAGATADTSTTTYNALGQIVTVVDNQTTTEYSYDGTDANGNTETRGLVTGVTVTAAGSSWSATAAYDGQGQVVVEDLPGGISRTHEYDTGGELTALTYQGPGTDSTGAPVTSQDWVGWSQASDGAGRTSHLWNPDGGSALLDGTATASDVSYTYDLAGRLTRADDITTDLNGNATCQRRGYGFDINSNRTSQSVSTNTGACSDTGATTSTRTYNAADQPTTTTAGSGGTYTYDPLGRQTTIPAADTTADTTAGNGDVSVQYDANDTAATITQGPSTVSFTLDAAGRRLTATTRSNLQVTDTLTRHYTDSSDNPSSSEDLAAGGTDTITRYAALTGDGLGMTIATSGTTTTAQLDVADPLGNIVSTITIPGNATNASGLDSWTHYTEYGQVAKSAPDDASPTGVTGIGYGWLGSHERATLPGLGLVLMGARLYNQATGLFTSPDPVYGGNATSYGYPTDPIDNQDLNGQFLSWLKRNAVTIATTAACIFGGPLVCTIASAAGAVYNASRKMRHTNWRSWRSVGSLAASFAWDIAGARVPAFRATVLKRALWGNAGRVAAAVPRRAMAVSSSRLTLRGAFGRVVQSRHRYVTGPWYSPSSYARALIHGGSSAVRYGYTGINLLRMG